MSWCESEADVILFVLGLDRRELSGFTNAETLSSFTDLDHDIRVDIFEIELNDDTHQKLENNVNYTARYYNGNRMCFHYWFKIPPNNSTASDMIRSLRQRKYYGVITDATIAHGMDSYFESTENLQALRVLRVAYTKEKFHVYQ